jgi:hypothetical protein
VLGVTERYDDFRLELVRRFGWRMTPLPARNVGGTKVISAGLRRRIGNDNRYDLELYEHALALLS